MAVITDINSLSTNAALNGPDGAVDLPSTLDDQMRYLGAFIAQLRDGLGTPAGMVTSFAGSTTPTGWIKANGALLSRATYAALFAYASAQGLVTEVQWAAGSFGRFSEGDGATTFRAPDLRAMFIRGLDESRGIDVSRAIGAFQSPTNQAHTHGVTDPTHNHGVSDPGHSHTTDSQGVHTHGYVGWTGSGAGAFSGATTVYAPTGAATDSAGAHAHNISLAGTGISIQGNPTGISIQSSGGESRPGNVAYPMFIKY